MSLSEVTDGREGRRWTKRQSGPTGYGPSVKEKCTDDISPEDAPTYGRRKKRLTAADFLGKSLTPTSMLNINLLMS